MSHGCMKMVSHVKGCSSQCPWCAREFWAWLKSRSFQMDRVMPGDSESFAQAAVNSARVK
jgi:wyosine [tRNA(Phe)-imidazoG37] synthetase (radical SAM superfamily)